MVEVLHYNRNKHRIVGVKANSGEQVEFDSIYAACVKLSGKRNSGLMCQSLRNMNLGGTPIIAYGYEWFYKEDINIQKKPLKKSTYKRIPKELQKKRGRVSTRERKEPTYKCYVYNENFEVINKFHKVTDCAKYYDITPRTVNSRIEPLTYESRYPRFINGLYFQRDEISVELREHLLQSKVSYMKRKKYDKR